MRLLPAFFVVALLAGAADTPLPLQPELWQRKVYNAPVPESEAAAFSISAAALSVGPWLAGTSSARFEFARPIPVVRGTLHGRYRTHSLYPRQAMVRIGFQAGTKSLSNRTYPLAASPEWREFALPIYRPPTGADGVSISVGLAEKSDGRVEFASLRVSNHYQAPDFGASDPPLRRPAAPPPMPGARYTRIERRGDAFWLVDPAGRPFFSWTSLTPGSRGDASDSSPERKLFDEMRRLGFNSLAGSHSVLRWARFNEAQAAAGQPVMLQFRTLETRVGSGYDTLLNAAGENPGTPQAQAASIGGFNHAFPDPFDPAWQTSFRDRVRETAAVVRGKPYYAAWFVDNERAHRDIHRYVWSKHCVAEFRRFLERKHSTVQALNRAWQSSFVSFDDLMRKKPDPIVRKGAMYEDFRLFSREILRRFNQQTLRIIREEDPGRLVFSNRFMLGEQRDMLDNLDLYRDFDAIAVNIYPANTSAGLDLFERQMLELIHQRTGRPILIGEWSVPALDSGLYENPDRLDWSYPQTVETQSQRARQSLRFLTDLYNLPFVIGAHWFTWSDYDSPTRQANRGLFQANGQPWRELQEALGRFSLALQKQSQAAAPPSRRKSGSPLDNLAPGMERLTWFGERADFSPDNRSVAFMAKSFGDAMTIELDTRRIHCLTCAIPAAAFLRVMHFSNGDYLLIGPEHFRDIRSSRHQDNELWHMSREPGARPVRLGQKMSEGAALSKRSLKIAFSETGAQNPELKGGASRITVAELDLSGGAPRLVNRKVVYGRPDNSCTLEAQDFYDNDARLTFTCYEPKGMASVWSLNLRSGQAVNMSQKPGAYNEVEGIFPGGLYTCVESDRQVEELGAARGFRQIDIWKLRLDGTGRDFTRLTRFNDYEGWKASNPVVSTDGRWMSFQVARTADEAGVGYGIMLYRLP